MYEYKRLTTNEIYYHIFYLNGVSRSYDILFNINHLKLNLYNNFVQFSINDNSLLITT